MELNSLVLSEAALIATSVYAIQGLKRVRGTTHTLLVLGLLLPAIAASFGALRFSGAQFTIPAGSFSITPATAHHLTDTLAKTTGVIGLGFGGFASFKGSPYSFGFVLLLLMMSLGFDAPALPLSPLWALGLQAVVIVSLLIVAVRSSLSATTKAGKYPGLYMVAGILTIVAGLAFLETLPLNNPWADPRNIFHYLYCVGIFFIYRSAYLANVSKKDHKW
eukprot:TRINITY_DN8147_c0_g1_i4.p1 TRINITY_DN8147_c0_g1~~TRINITY_DN8147_c0_g1_i4.p1  ORF type:complete len:220 (-),score=28.12 TRINITY_DN8147_c0_g1_i4:102-761(-)